MVPIGQMVAKMTLAPDEKTARVSASGKLNLPARYRKLIGLEQGGPVRIRVVDGEIRIRTVQAAMEALQAQAKAALKGDSVESFLSDKRKDAARENEGA
jgi:bifunctional DNA-binding transcriptional regulator/antitoxin component of YhaV-PrlF toxin-antitoxin module